MAGTTRKNAAAETESPEMREPEPTEADYAAAAADTLNAILAIVTALSDDVNRYVNNMNKTLTQRLDAIDATLQARSGGVVADALTILAQKVDALIEGVRIIGEHQQYTTQMAEHANAQFQQMMGGGGPMGLVKAFLKGGKPAITDGATPTP